MEFSKALYFAALLPPEEVKEEIRQLKLEVKERVGASHALKLPAHITLLAPFRLESSQEKDLFKTLTAATSKFTPFNMELEGFGRFGQRVLFIQVANPEPVRKLHQELQNLAGKIAGMTKEASFHPHITLATRDLSKEKFFQLWPNFGKREYSRIFTVDRLYLFRHNGKTWEVIGEFSFGSV